MKTTNFSVAMIARDETQIPEWVFQKLSQQNIKLQAKRCENAADFYALVKDADLIWLAGANHFITGEILSRLPRCGAILRTGSGVNDIPVDVATVQGVIVANTPDALVEAVAEHTVALLLASVRRLLEQDKGVRRGVWNDVSARPINHMRGSTLGVISFGRIARRVVEMLSGFHLKILAHDPFVTDDFIQAHGAISCSLKVLFQQSDFVLIHCPLTEKTRFLIGEKELQSMKPNAILINTARGAIIDEKALARALQKSTIAGAALDVLETEPPEKDNPLLHLENVILTPHIAAFSDQFEENFWRYSAETIIDLSRKRWPRSVVNRHLVPKWKMA